jgi:hypothetical protein
MRVLRSAPGRLDTLEASGSEKKNEQVSLFCPYGDELHDIEKLFIEYAWVFYTKAAAPRDAAQQAPGGRRRTQARRPRLDESHPGPSCYAPQARPRHHGDFRTRTHIRASSLPVPKMSAGITNPCASINQPARALALGTDRLAHAGQRNNHYGCPTIRKAVPRDPAVKGKACASSTAAWQLKRGAADGGESEALPRADGGRSAAPPTAAEARRR